MSFVAFYNLAYLCAKNHKMLSMHSFVTSKM